MKIRVLSRERCLEISKEMNPGLTNISDREHLEWLPDEVFNKIHEAEDEGDSFFVNESGYTWLVPPHFAKVVNPEKVKLHKVTITETLQREVWVEADSSEEASEIVQREYREQKHVLTADDHAETTFTVETGTVEEVQE